MARRAAETGGRLASRVPVVTGRPHGWARRRDMMARHLRRVYGPDVDRRRLDRLVDEAVASYARYWAETLRLPDHSPAQIDAGIRYTGFEHIWGGRAAGRGTILTLPHVGGWEWAGAHLATIGLPVSVVVEKLSPDDLFEWFVSFRRRLGMNVIPVGPGAAAQCGQALADNHVLCLMSDRLIAGTTGVEVEFFGEKTMLPAGPATLAIRTGAVLAPVGVFFEPETEGHFGAILDPIPTERTGRLRDDVQHVTQLMAWAFEDLVRRAPTQWHMMQPNWPSDVPDGEEGGS